MSLLRTTPVVPEDPVQADNGIHAHLVHYILDSLRGPSQHDRPARRPSPESVLRNGFQSCSKGDVNSEQPWLRLRTLLLLIIFLPLFCLYVNPLRLFAKTLVLNRDGISEMRESLPLSIGCRHQKETRCLPAARRVIFLRLRSLPRGAGPAHPPSRGGVKQPGWLPSSVVQAARLLPFLCCSSPAACLPQAARLLAFLCCARPLQAVCQRDCLEEKQDQ